MQPEAPLSRRALRKVPLWAQKAMGLDKHLAHREIMEITRMFRASQAAGEDARPRIVTMGDAMQVVLPPFLAYVRIWGGPAHDMSDIKPGK